MRYQGIDRGKPVGGGSETIDGHESATSRHPVVIGHGTLCLAGGAGAQESLDQGKSAGPAFRLGLFGLSQIAARAGQGWRAVRGSIVSCASTIRRAGNQPPRLPITSNRWIRARRRRREHPSGVPKAMEPLSLATGKSRRAKPGEAKGVSKSSESKPPDARPSDILAPEPKSTASKPAIPVGQRSKACRGS